jgi:hypothetical protein
LRIVLPVCKSTKIFDVIQTQLHNHSFSILRNFPDVASRLSLFKIS